MEDSMPYQKDPAMSSTIEVLDRVLDKGVVIDTSYRVSVVGIALVDVDVHIVIASIETYNALVNDFAESLSESDAGESSGALQITETSGGLAPDQERGVEDTPDVVDEDPANSTTDGEADPPEETPPAG